MDSKSLCQVPGFSRGGPAVDMAMCHPTVPKTYRYCQSKRGLRLRAGGGVLHVTSLPEGQRMPGKGRKKR